MNLSQLKHWMRFVRSHLVLVQSRSGATLQYDTIAVPSQKHINSRTEQNDQTSNTKRHKTKLTQALATSHPTISVYTMQSFNVNYSHSRLSLYDTQDIQFATYIWIAIMGRQARWCICIYLDFFKYTLYSFCWNIRKNTNEFEHHL